MLAASLPGPSVARPEAARPATGAAPAAAPATAARATRDAAFSAGEAASLVTALAPIARAMEAAGHPEAFAGFVAQLADRRAKGEDVQVVVFEAPGGGGLMATVMSAAELRAALESDDPDSLGSVTTNDGRHFKVRDVLRAALLGKEGPNAGPGEAAPALSPKDAVAAAVADLLAAARNGAATGGTEASRFLWRAGTDGDAPRIGILSLPALPHGARAGSPLLDAVA